MKGLKVTLFAFAMLMVTVVNASGGEGATSCSREFSILGVGWSHSVECGEGYYAKCGLFKAKCVENKN